jgi:hypothetical protein
MEASSAIGLVWVKLDEQEALMQEVLQQVSRAA